MKNKSSVLKTGRKCTWDEIKVGEVFAWNGCCVIFIKTSEIYCEQIASTEPRLYEFESVWNKINELNDFYKLPKSVQRLWLS